MLLILPSFRLLPMLPRCYAADMMPLPFYADIFYADFAS